MVDRAVADAVPVERTEAGERWIASGADAAGNAGWRLLATRWLHSTGRGCQDPAHDHCIFGSG